MAFRAVVVAAVLAFASAGMDPGYMNMMGGGMMNMQQMMNMNQMMGGHQQVYILSTALLSILWETLICAGATCSAKESWLPVDTCDMDNFEPEVNLLWEIIAPEQDTPEQLVMLKNPDFLLKFATS